MTQPLTPTQADRDAVAEYLEALHRDYPGADFTVAESHGEETRQGRCDNFKLVQAFTRHAQAARLEGARAMREAVDNLIAHAEHDEFCNVNAYASSSPGKCSCGLTDAINSARSLDALSIAEKGV